MKFESAVEHVLAKEGGYVNHPRDPGGETNWGISKRAYPMLDIRGLTREDAKEIYKRDYWVKPGIEKLPHWLRLMVFESAVNQGAQVAVALLQAALGVKPDGDLGPVSLEALSKVNQEKLLQAYTRFRLNRYFDDRNFPVFGEGWIRRLVEGAILSATLIGKVDEA